MTGVLTRSRIAAGALLVAYVALLLFILGESDPSRAIGVVGRVAAGLELAGVPALLSEPSRVEFVLNAAMFAPVALLAGLAIPRHPWANWVVYGFVASGAVELVQGLLLPLRSAQYVDVVANTAGMLTGAVLSLLVAQAHRSDQSSTKAER